MINRERAEKILEKASLGCKDEYNGDELFEHIIEALDAVRRETIEECAGVLDAMAGGALEVAIPEHERLFRKIANVIRALKGVE